MDASKQPVSTDAAPAAIGPYSQAVVCGGWLITSGQIGLDPGTGQMVEGGVEGETHRVLQNLQAILEARGASLADVARCTVYLKDLSDFQAVNEIYAGYFQEPHPARACVEVARLPKDALVEIDAMARVADDAH